MIFQAQVIIIRLKHVVFYTAVVLLLFASCNQEKSHVDKKTATTTTGVDTALKWVDYRIGEPPLEGYYTAFDSIIKKWNIRYERIEGGCEELPDERSKYEKDNPKYFKILETKFGKDWLTRFHADVKALESKLHER